MELRELSIIKTDGDNSMYWVAPEADTLKEYYGIVWNSTRYQQTNLYAIFQKWADQSISADLYATFKGDEKINSSDLIKETNYIADMGQKTVYYTNSDTSDKEALKSVFERVRREVQDDGLDMTGPVCTSGGCSV
jgi:ribonucleoside-diphosphate reductase alpha chain